MYLLNHSIFFLFFPAIEEFVQCNTPPLPLGEDELKRLYLTSSSYYSTGKPMSHSEIKTAAKVLEKKGYVLIHWTLEDTAVILNIQTHIKVR